MDFRLNLTNYRLEIPVFDENVGDFLLEVESWDYLRSDFLNSDEQEIEAEVPVPDRLLPKSEYRNLVAQLKLSQKIGLLLWMHRSEVLSIGGRQRLLYLQEKASFEAISAGLKFAERLSRDKKLQSDFIHCARELNRRPQSKRFRKYEARRIGVGYRDKGTLPDPSSKSRRKAEEEAFISAFDLPEVVLAVISGLCPQAVEGDWVELPLLETLTGVEKEFLTQLVHSL